MSDKNKSITPLCCATVQKYNTVFLCFDDEVMWYGGSEGFTNKKPKWKSGSFDWDSNSWDDVEVKFCPHCATPVPEIRKRSTTEKICNVTDGGYYCDTCQERLGACTCHRPEYAWEPLPPQQKSKRYNINPYDTVAVAEILKNKKGRMY